MKSARERPTRVGYTVTCAIACLPTRTRAGSGQSLPEVIGGLLLTLWCSPALLRTSLAIPNLPIRDWLRVSGCLLLLDALPLTAEARALYVGFANAIEAEIGPAGSLAMVRAFASKLPENAARIAGTLALIWDADAHSIDRDTLADAIALAKYYLAEAVRLVASGAIDPELRQAETLRERPLSQPGNVIGLRDIYRFGPNSIRQADKARTTMKVLVEHGWARPLPDGAEIDGKVHREAWRIIRC